MKHAQSFVVKMPIAFPSVVCEIILSQYLGILVSTNVASKRESPLSLHNKLFKGTHVPYIVMTSKNEIANSTSKNGVLAEMKEVSKALEETIKINTERKTSVEKLILALSTKTGELDEDEGVAEENDGAANNKDEEVVGNT